MRSPDRKRSAVIGILLAGILVVLAGGVVASVRQAEATDPELDAVLARFDEVQRNIQSMSADFDQTTVNPLLDRPMSAKGRFFLRKPASVLWEYVTPESMYFAIDDGKYTGYFPDRRKAERRDVHRWTEQIFRFFALGQVSDELKKFYEIRLEDAGPDMKGTHLMVLAPTKRRVQKRVEQVRLWVDANTSLPVKVQYVNREGATRTLLFRDVRLNPDLSAGTFQVRIPADVTVTTGFTELGAAGGPSPSGAN